MPYAATIGFFDGVHSGHRYLLSVLRKTAQARGLQSAVITFEQHPETFLRGVPKPLLTTYDERIALLRAESPDEIFCFQFPVVRHMTAAEFLSVLHDHCGVQLLLMGYDHRFGSDRLTAFEDYEHVAQQAGVQLLPIDRAPEGAVSSSAIRRALLQGDCQTATAMLTRPYSMRGRVVHGRAIGRTIGFPTANIEVDEDKLIPADGVYAARVTLPSAQTKSALLNIGTNPTIQASQRTLELHILDYDGNLYGTSLRVELLRYLRPESQFASLNLLQEQIQHDIQSLKQPD